MGKLMSVRTRGFESHSRRLKCGILTATLLTLVNTFHFVIVTLQTTPYTSRRSTEGGKKSDLSTQHRPYNRKYFKAIFQKYTKKASVDSPKNASIICDYINDRNYPN